MQCSGCLCCFLTTFNYITSFLSTRNTVFIHLLSFSHKCLPLDWIGWTTCKVLLYRDPHLNWSFKCPHYSRGINWVLFCRCRSHRGESSSLFVYVLSSRNQVRFTRPANTTNTICHTLIFFFALVWFCENQHD